MPTAVFTNGVATISVGDGLSAGQYTITIEGLEETRKVNESLGTSNQVAVNVQSMIIADAATFATAVEGDNAWFTFSDSVSRVWRVRFIA